MGRIVSKFEDSNLIKRDHSKKYQMLGQAKDDNFSLFTGEDFEAGTEKIIRMNKTDRAFIPEGRSHERNKSSVDRRVIHFDTMRTTSDCY